MDFFIGGAFGFAIGAGLFFVQRWAANAFGHGWAAEQARRAQIIAQNAERLERLRLRDAEIRKREGDVEKARAKMRRQILLSNNDHV